MTQGVEQASCQTDKHTGHAVLYMLLGLIAAFGLLIVTLGTADLVERGCNEVRHCGSSWASPSSLVEVVENLCYRPSCWRLAWWIPEVTPGLPNAGIRPHHATLIRCVANRIVRTWKVDHASYRVCEGIETRINRAWPAQC